jgi:hypothetical protein
MAPLRHIDGLQECPLIGVDRKSSARRQIGAIDPNRTLRALRQELWYPPSNAMGRFNEAADLRWHLLLVLSVLVSCDCTRI